MTIEAGVRGCSEKKEPSLRKPKVRSRGERGLHYRRFSRCYHVVRGTMIAARMSGKTMDIVSDR